MPDSAECDNCYVFQITICAEFSKNIRIPSNSIRITPEFRAQTGTHCTLGPQGEGAHKVPAHVAHMYIYIYIRNHFGSKQNSATGPTTLTNCSHSNEIFVQMREFCKANRPSGAEGGVNLRASISFSFLHEAALLASTERKARD